jgi:hypothetical protein
MGLNLGADAANLKFLDDSRIDPENHGFVAAASFCLKLAPRRARESKNPRTGADSRILGDVPLRDFRRLPQGKAFLRMISGPGTALNKPLT